MQNQDMQKTNIYFLPYAGASKYAYKSFIKNAPENIEVIPIDIPGRGSRFKENLATDIMFVIDDIFNQLDSQLNKNYALYGHSMGALLGYLLVKKIQKEGRNLPLHLFVSGAGGPSTYKNRIEKYHLLPESLFFEKIKELDGMPEEVFSNYEMRSFIEPIIRADFKLVETYNYIHSTPLHVPILVMTGINDKISYEEALAWNLETNQIVEIKEFPGKHFFIFKHQKELLEIFSNRIFNNL